MESLAPWLETVFFGNTVKDYATALVIFLSLALILILAKRFLVHHLGYLAKRTKGDFDDFLVSLLAQVRIPAFFAIALYVASLSLQLDPAVRTVVRLTLVFVLTIRGVLMLQAIVRYSVTKSFERSHASDPSAAALAKNVTYALTWVLWSVATVFVLDNLGVNISSLVAGLGIGGVAVALASQAVLGDLFSALSIAVDKPFTIGDFIIVDDLMGTVEHVGLKTTRIRSLQGEQLVFSNSDLTKSRIKNYKRMENRRVVFKIGVVYQTSPEKLRRAKQIIQETIHDLKGVKLDRAHFQSFGDFSLVFEVAYYIQSPDYNVFMDKQEEINLQILKRFADEGIEFAYPTQTLFMAGISAGTKTS